MKLIENPEVDPYWVVPHSPHSGLVIAESSDCRWLAVQMAFTNWRLIGVPVEHEESNPEHGWCFRGQVALYAAVGVWDAEREDEPLGWHKRAGVWRRAPLREESPEYNLPRCVHGTYLHAPYCERAMVCAEFPGVFGPMK